MSENAKEIAKTNIMFLYAGIAFGAIMGFLGGIIANFTYDLVKTQSFFVPYMLLLLAVFFGFLGFMMSVVVKYARELTPVKETKTQEKPKEEAGKQKEKKKRAIKLAGFVLSKWFWYGVIAVFLAILLFADLGSAYWFNNDFAIRFMPTLFGLVFNFAIFIVFFDLREELEWKEVEGRVKSRIGREARSLFSFLIMFCQVDRVLFGDVQSEQTWKELDEKQFNQITKKVVLNESLMQDLLRERNLALNYALLGDGIRTRFSEIEDKYGRFLNPKLRASLMDIQDYLADFRYELKSFGSTKRLSESLSPLIEKLAKEITTIRENGINVGF
jgi:hypothetical protein